MKGINMTNQFKIGDRVQVVSAYNCAPYQVGDAGTVSDMRLIESGVCYCVEFDRLKSLSLTYDWYVDEESLRKVML